MNRVRPMGTSIPPGLQLRSDYRSSSGNPTPQTSAFPVQGAPLSTPAEYHFPQLSAPYQSAGFNNSPYRQQPNNVSTINMPSSAGIFPGTTETAHGQRTPHEASSRAPNSPSSLPTQTTFEIPRRSFTYDYGNQRS